MGKVPFNPAELSRLYVLFLKLGSEHHAETQAPREVMLQMLHDHGYAWSDVNVLVRQAEEIERKPEPRTRARPSRPPREGAKSIDPRLEKIRAEVPAAFSDKYLCGKKLPLIGIEYEVAEASGLRIFVKKSRSFGWRYRRPDTGKPAKLIFGKYPGVSLADAHVKLAAAKKQLENGIDPGVAKQNAKAETKARAADTVEAIGEKWIKALRREGKLRDIDRHEAELRKYVYPRIGPLPLSQVRKSTVLDMCEAIEDEVKARGSYDGRRTGQKVYTLINQLLNWHAKRADDFANPLPRGLRDTATRKRGRVLNDAEIVSVVGAAQVMGRDDQGNIADAGQAMFGSLVEALLRNGFRRSEMAEASWSEFAGNVHTLPAHRNKVSRPDAPIEVVRTLPRRVMRILNAQPRHAGCDYVFSVEGRCPINKFARHKKTLDRLAGFTDENGKLLPGVKGWTLHDLRRTCRTLMSRAEVPVDHAERALGHVIGGVRGTYDKWEFLHEKRATLVAVNRLISRILAGRA
jgi:integrase